MVQKKNSVKKSAKKAMPPSKKSDKTMAIVGLILNILILPGLGTLIGGGKTSTGVIQILMVVVSIILDITIIGLIIGLPLGLAAWIWGIFSGIKLLQ